MPDPASFEKYQSPFAWRYGSEAMRHIWGETHKRQLWRQIWFALATVQSEFGLVSTDQLDDLQAHLNQVNISRSLEIEAEIQHDLMAELKAYAEQCPVGGSILHLGATSMDIEDNTDALRIRQSLGIILNNLKQLLTVFTIKIVDWADLPILGFTHLQPAEPSTLGYRLAFYAQDLLSDWEHLKTEYDALKGKGFKGAVGNSATYVDLMGAREIIQFEKRLSQILGLPFYPVTGQTYPRKQEYQILCALAGAGASLYKLALDLRFLQSPPLGEWSEPFGSKQVGSSAMPFKRNPIQAEKINSLARTLAQFPRIAWDNAANSMLERTLDDSANRRSLLPEAFLISDEIIKTAIKIITGLRVNEEAIKKNLAIYAPFSSTERVLMALVKAGADRQAMHAHLRDLSLKAWEAVEKGQNNLLADYLSQDALIAQYLPPATLLPLMEITSHVGTAPHQARHLAELIKTEISTSEIEELGLDLPIK